MLIDIARLDQAPADIRRRLLVGAIVWMSGAIYPPRRDDIARLLRDLGADTRQTLGGCLIERRGPTIRLTREARAVETLTCASDAVWDQRWQLIGPHHPALTIRALGRAVADCPDWRATGMPRNSLLASPAIWHGDTLVAAPVAGYNTGWQARIVADFATSLIAH
jgi:tRNA(Ile)-lysidine synthase